MAVIMKEFWMALGTFLFIQIWNVIAVLGNYLFCELPFVKAHIVNNPYGRVDWAPYILLYVLTSVYYVWVSVRYSRSWVAVIDQSFCFALYAFFAMWLAVETPFFLNSAWNYIQFWAIEFFETISVFIGSVVGVIWVYRTRR